MDSGVMPPFFAWSTIAPRSSTVDADHSIIATPAGQVHHKPPVKLSLHTGLASAFV